jgi:hypothetical protein
MEASFAETEEVFFFHEGSLAIFYCGSLPAKHQPAETAKHFGQISNIERITPFIVMASRAVR